MYFVCAGPRYTMYSLLLIALLLISRCETEVVYTRVFNFRADAGRRTCFYETARAGQTLEVYYQVLDGQQGDLDISMDVIDPSGKLLVSDYKKSQNAVIKDLETDGEYAFCLDNSFSLMNAKLVFFYLMLEDQSVTAVTGRNHNDGEVGHHWEGMTNNGETYHVDIEYIADCMSRTLKHVVKARHLLEIYAAGKSRDSHVVFKDTHFVDAWSTFQISLMCFVGLVQVYMIRNLFSTPRK